MDYLSFKQKNKKDKNNKNNQNDVLLQDKPLNNQSLSSKFSKNNMLVAVRTRPLSKSEQEDSNFNTISVPQKDIIKLSMPTEYIPDDMSGIFLAGEQIKILKLKEISYEYDFVFGENSTQEEVYENTTASLINQVVEGYSATIMAYGATGSGKTYTMVGKGEKVGLMIRAIRDLFNFVNSQKEQDKLYNIKITYIEVYNEILKDLLTDKKTSIEIRHDPNKGVIIQGAECIKVENENEAFKLINSGNKRRTEKQTERNKYSSRSHAVLQIYLEIQEQKNNNNKINNYPNFNSDISFGKLYLVDLAGSERTTSIGTKNKIQVEAGSINKSLLALSKCINLIVTQNKKFIPFRESKLTRILQEPLSGNGRIVLIATLSPAILNFDETLFTLHFANRAKCMKIHMKKNVIENDKEIIEKYEDYIKNLRDEINEVENEIAEQKNIQNIKEDENNKNELNEENKEYNDKISKIQKEISDHFKTEIDLRKKIIDEEEKIEKLKNDLNSLDYEMIHKPRVNLEYLKNEYDTKKGEIEKIKQKINEDYIKENELISQRREFKKVINELNINNAGNFKVLNLFHIYKYYTNLLENMANEHKKIINMNEMQRKENKISLLNEQLDLRDLFIDNAKQELNKNNIIFKYSNPNLATKEEIELQSYDPFKIKNEINDIFNTEIESKNTFDISKLKNSYYNINERFNEINKINKQLSKSPDIIKENKNNNINIFKRNGSTFNKKKILVDAGANLLNKNNFRNSSKQNFRSQNNSKNIESKYSSFFINKKTSNNFGDDSIISRLENEVQKKVKTILKKDFIGRYKRSPYLKIFNE